MGLHATLKQSLAKMLQGPMSVVIDPDSDNVALFANGGVAPNIVRGFEEVEVDEIGIYDLRTSGDAAEIELNLPETSIDVLNVLFPEGRDGSTESPPYQGFGRAAGYSMRALAKQIRIRPWQTRTSSAVQLVLWLCVPTGDLGTTLNKSEPHTFTQTFRALPDLDRADGDLIGRFYAPARS